MSLSPRPRTVMLPALVMHQHVGPSFSSSNVYRHPSYVPTPMPFPVTVAPSVVLSLPLTHGLADPASVDAQRRNYHKDLDAQYASCTAQLGHQKKQQIDQLLMQAEALKNQISVKVDQQMVEAKLRCEQAFNAQTLELQHHAASHKHLLEHRAIEVTAEAQQRKLQGEMYAKEHELQTESQFVQQKFIAEARQNFLEMAQSQVNAGQILYAPPIVRTCRPLSFVPGVLPSPLALQPAVAYLTPRGRAGYY